MNIRLTEAQVVPTFLFCERINITVPVDPIDSDDIMSFYAHEHQHGMECHQSDDESTI
jgi:hypothetical protein